MFLLEFTSVSKGGDHAIGSAASEDGDDVQKWMVKDDNYLSGGGSSCIAEQCTRRGLYDLQES